MGVSMCQNMYVYVGVHVQLCAIGLVGGWVCRRMCMGMCVRVACACMHACAMESEEIQLPRLILRDVKLKFLFLC